MALNQYEDGFVEFFESGKREEKEMRFRVAVSNYYKALTELCSYIIEKELSKTPASHTEIFLFLKSSFHETYTIVDPLFKIYQKTYTSSRYKEDCERIKEGIKKIVETKRISGKIGECIKEKQ